MYCIFICKWVSLLECRAMPFKNIAIKFLLCAPIVATISHYYSWKCPLRSQPKILQMCHHFGADNTNTALARLVRNMHRNICMYWYIFICVHIYELAFKLYMFTWMCQYILWVCISIHSHLVQSMRSVWLHCVVLLLLYRIIKMHIALHWGSDVLWRQYTGNGPFVSCYHS